MINNLLEIIRGDGSNHYLGIVAGSSNSYYFSDLGESLVYALIGILIVFVGIAIVVGILYLVGFIMKKTTGKEFFKRKKKSMEVVAETVSESDEVPDEVKAAIVAALMAYYSQENPKCEFKVKRIKRI